MLVALSCSSSLSPLVPACHSFCRRSRSSIQEFPSCSTVAPPTVAARSPLCHSFSTALWNFLFTWSWAECFTEPPLFATLHVYKASCASVREEMLMWLEKSSMVILTLGKEASMGASLSNQVNWRGRSPLVATQEAWTRSPSLPIGIDIWWNVGWRQVHKFLWEKCKNIFEDVRIRCIIKQDHKPQVCRKLEGP